MAIHVHCPTCEAELRVPDELAEREVHCGVCQALFTLPPAPAPRPAEPAPLPDAESRPADRLELPAGPYPRARPAVRRRRPPPPPPGRGPLFWIAALGGAAIFAAFACCGGGYLLIPGEKWRTYQSPGGYSADFPLTPNPDMKIPGVKSEPGTHTEGGILWKRGECYVVFYGDTLPRNGRIDTDEQMLQEAVKAMSSEADVRRVLRDQPVTVSGFPGREVEFEDTDGGIYLGRVVIADRRVFVILGGGRFVRRGNANIRRFVDSFEVTDPTLEGGAAFERQKQGGPAGRKPPPPRRFGR